MSPIKLSPFYLSVTLYTLANITYAITAIINKSMLIEFFYYSVDTNLLIKALILQSISLLFLVICYETYKRNAKFKSIEINGYGNFAGSILLIYQFFYIVLAIFFGVGVVGQDEVKINALLFSLISFLSADAVFFIVGTQLKSKKIFRINLIIYLISSIVRGWLGGILIAFFIYLCRKEFLIVRVKSLFFYVFGIIVIYLLSPILIDLKFAIRNEVKLSLDFTDYSEKLQFATDYLLSRFQHVGHIYIMLEKEGHYYQAYQQSMIRSFLLEGNIQYSLYNKLVELNDISLSEFMVIKEFNGTWNTNTGLVGWLIVLRESVLFFIIYWFLLILATYKIISKYATKQLFLVISLFMIVYLYHGWLSSFFNLIFLTWFLVISKKIRL